MRRRAGRLCMQTVRACLTACSQTQAKSLMTLTSARSTACQRIKLPTTPASALSQMHPSA